MVCFGCTSMRMSLSDCFSRMTISNYLSLDLRLVRDNIVTDETKMDFCHGIDLLVHNVRRRWMLDVALYAFAVTFKTFSVFVNNTIVPGRTLDKFRSRPIV